MKQLFKSQENNPEKLLSYKLILEEAGGGSNVYLGLRKKLG